MASQVGKGWTEMQRTMHNIKQSVDDLPTVCPERKKILGAFDNWDQGIDTIALIRNSLGRPYKEHTFFRRHFMHCGLWIHYMRTIMFHQQGVAYAAVPGTVLCTTQLYHALKQEQSLNHD